MLMVFGRCALCDEKIVHLDGCVTGVPAGSNRIVLTCATCAPAKTDAFWNRAAAAPALACAPGD